MNKVICDVCGTDYPETASQCPICGCARAGSAQTSAGNTAGEERPAYTYVKGGRFSKANVRKRLKGAQVATAAPKKTAAPKEPEVEEQEPEEERSGSNVALIVIVILLLLAIIAVSGYILVEYVDFDLFGGKTEPSTQITTQPTIQTDPTEPTTVPTEPTVKRIPCTGLTLSNGEEVLTEMDSVLTLEYAIEPADTTDEVIFSSLDESIAVVDENGRVTAVGSGETVISVECGSFKRKCKIVCQFEEPQEPLDPAQSYIMKINGRVSRYGDEFNADVSLKLGDTFKLTLEDANGNLQDVTWVISDETSVTVEGTTVTATAKNKGVKISVSIGEHDYVCIVRIS